MPRAVVTTELCETIRSLRSQNKIHSKALAAHIGKSPAYVSKLEKGDIQTIDLAELASIFHFITKEDSDTKSAEQVYESLKLKCSADEIEDLLWFRNFDTIKRSIPIPESLVEMVNNEIEQLNISRSYLCSRINSNEHLSPSDRENNAISDNIWYDNHANEGLKSSIKINISQELLDDILNHDVTSTSYMFVFCIVFYLHKIKAYGQVITISDEDYQTLYNQTTEILNNYKFYSISERNFILGKEVHDINEKIEQILSSFNYDNATYIEQILTQLMIASDINIESTNKQLRAFSDNLNWDLGFMLKIISMDFSKLKETSFSNKKELLGKISQLIEEYNELPANQNKIEKY